MMFVTVAVFQDKGYSHHHDTFRIDEKRLWDDTVKFPNFWHSPCSGAWGEVCDAQHRLLHVYVTDALEL